MHFWLELSKKIFYDIKKFRVQLTCYFFTKSRTLRENFKPQNRFQFNSHKIKLILPPFTKLINCDLPCILEPPLHTHAA